MNSKGNVYVLLILSTETPAKELERQFVLVKIATFEWNLAESKSLDNSEYNMEYLNICQLNQSRISISINKVGMILNYL